MDCSQFSVEDYLRCYSVRVMGRKVLARALGFPLASGSRARSRGRFDREQGQMTRSIGPLKRCPKV